MGDEGWQGKLRLALVLCGLRSETVLYAALLHRFCALLATISALATRRTNSYPAFGLICCHVSSFSSPLLVFTAQYRFWAEAWEVLGSWWGLVARLFGGGLPHRIDGGVRRERWGPALHGFCIGWCVCPWPVFVGEDDGNDDCREVV